MQKVLKYSFLVAIINACASTPTSTASTGISKTVISAVVQKHRSEVRECYNTALRNNSTLEGTINVAFTIQPDGIVSAAKVLDSTVDDTKLQNCILERLKTWIFPQPESPIVTKVEKFPFVLKPVK
jgi:outer membrane biosynthesis protein TonB